MWGSIIDKGIGNVVCIHIYAYILMRNQVKIDVIYIDIVIHIYRNYAEKLSSDAQTIKTLSKAL